MRFSWLTTLERPLIVSHRGSSAVAPENTLAAFKQAMIDGADAIELDVHLSKDAEVVVIHDYTLNRTTNGKGKVADFTLTDLKQLDAGSWFDKKFSKEKIPTLKEVFELTKERIGINIEIKANSKREDDYQIINSLIEVIEEYKTSKWVLISSFQPKIIEKIKAIKPEILTGVIYSPTYSFLKRKSTLVSKVGANVFICNKYYLRKKLVEEAHKLGIFVGTYEINTSKSLKRVLNFGVDCIVTNNPRRIINFLKG